MSSTKLRTKICAFVVELDDKRIDNANRQSAKLFERVAGGESTPRTLWVIVSLSSDLRSSHGFNVCYQRRTSIQSTI